jgi:heme/copper-type cytochrome/quinol oxidase subunit 2
MNEIFRAFRPHAGAFALAVALAALAGGADAKPASYDVAVSDEAFTPSAPIVTRVGQLVALNLRSSNGVHGIEAPQLGIVKTMILPGKTTQVTFTPKKAGTYRLPCVIPCGPYHEKMALVITVKP